MLGLGLWAGFGLKSKVNSIYPSSAATRSVGEMERVRGAHLTNRVSHLGVLSLGLQVAQTRYYI